LQNDLQQNDFKKSIKLLAESFVAESLSTESFTIHASPSAMQDKEDVLSADDADVRRLRKRVSRMIYGRMIYDPCVAFGYAGQGRVFTTNHTNLHESKKENRRIFVTEFSLIFTN